MPARARKKKKASDGVEPAPPGRPPAVEPPGDTVVRRAVPDPQGPPVVAPMLMPAVVLADREDAVASAVVGAAVDSAAIAPVAEAIMSVTAPPLLSITWQGYELPPVQQGETREPVASPQHAGRAESVGAAEDDVWRAPDEARLLVQSPRRLFLYWRFARDPRELLREALGPVAERFVPAVRLVNATTGEEGEAATAEGGDYWFDVLPGRLLRAEVGFHGEGLPFVRLISSNTVETPAVGVSPIEDEAPEFRVAGGEFESVLEATGFAAEERHERPDAPDGRVDPAQPGAQTRPDEPMRARASSDTARPASSPRGGGHFSQGRGELF